ncbi:MAG: proteasome subunit alpha [Propionibacterium sp.]|nr:MAG: proteasome subunit alpha [Propionibacterium sp.]
MSMPIYVSPEQQMADRAQFARDGIAKGRSVIVRRFADGILLLAENRSSLLHKVAEIYDRIGFGAVGRYNEFENLRLAGIRHADMRGYAYHRDDVTGRGLANAYAQLMGTHFSSAFEKPFEVALAVAELGEDSDADQIFFVNYDGQLIDEPDFTVLGGNAAAIRDELDDNFNASDSLTDAVAKCVQILSAVGESKIAPQDLELGLLDRNRTHRRKFVRFDDSQIAKLLDA